MKILAVKKIKVNENLMLQPGAFVFVINEFGKYHIKRGAAIEVDPKKSYTAKEIEEEIKKAKKALVKENKKETN
jgi:hypothetical protein